MKHIRSRAKIRLILFIGCPGLPSLPQIIENIRGMLVLPKKQAGRSFVICEENKKVMMNFENGRHLYTVGGTVQASGGLYICREADDELFALCRAGSFAYVLTARQLGKSSLMVQTAERLMAEGTRCVLIDVTLLGTELTAEKWYLGLLALVGARLRLKTNVVRWWRANAHLGGTQRLVSFFQEVVVEECSSSVVIFLDEIDSTLTLSFTDDFFAAIRALYNARAHIPALKRLTFVLIGVATPSDLISEPKRTPFNIGQRVELSDFTPQEAAPLAKGLGLPLDQARQVLDQLLKWTGGHPYLTQRLCLAFTQQPKASPSDAPKAVDQVVARTFFGEMSIQDSNLQFVRDMLTKRAPDPPAVLTTYRAIRLGRRPVYDEEQSLIKNHLKLSGVVHREGNVLRVRNSIYEEVFNRRWIQEQLPMSWWDTVPTSVKASVFMMAGLVVALLFSLSFAINKQQEAEDARVTAVAARATAETAASRESEIRATAETAADRESEARTMAEAAATRESEARARAEASADKEKVAHATAEAALRETEAALTKMEEAQAQAEKANVKAEEATQREQNAQANAASMSMAGEALSELSNQKPNQALILALAAVPSDMTSYPVPVSQALRKTIAETESVRHVLAGDSERVSLVAWAPDGQQVLTSSQDGSVHLWDTTTGQLLNTLDTPSAAVMSVAWAANGPQIVTASHVGMRIWDVARAESVKTFAYDDSQSRPSQASHPPQELKSRRFNGARIWEPGTNQSLNLRQPEYSSGIRSVAWNPNSELVATGDEEGSLQIWNIETDQLLHSFDAHSTAILSLAWSANGQQVLIGREYGIIDIWNMRTNKLALSLEGDSSAIRAVAWSPNGQKVLTGSQDGTGKIWNTATGQTIHTLKGHSGALLSVAWSPNGEQVLTGSDDNKVRIWEAATGQLLKTLAGHSAPVRSVAWHPNRQQVITGSDDGSARIWDVQTDEANPLQAPSEVLRPQEPEAADDSLTVPTSNNSGSRALLESNIGQFSSLNERSDSIWSVAWRLDGPQLLTSGKMGAQIWNATTAQPLTALKGLSDDVWPVAWSPYGQKIVTSSIRDRNARIWEVASGELLQTLSGDFEAINSVAWRLDGEQVVTGHLDGTLRIWDAATGSRLQRLRGHSSAISSLAWSPYGQKLLTGHWDGSIQVCEVPTLRQAQGTATTCVLLIKGHNAHSDIVWSVAWSPDGQHLLTGSNDQRARIWNATTGDLLHTLAPEPSAAVFSVAWHPNGQQVLTGSNDHSARIWKSATGDLLHTFNLHSQRVWSVAWSPNGQQVLTSSWDGTARISIADETLLVAKLTERVCTVWHHQQDAIRNQIPEWRGCEVELAAVADKLAAYNALRDGQ